MKIDKMNLRSSNETIQKGSESNIVENLGNDVSGKRIS